MDINIVKEIALIKSLRQPRLDPNLIFGVLCLLVILVIYLIENRGRYNQPPMPYRESFNNEKRPYRENNLIPY